MNSLLIVIASLFSLQLFAAEIEMMDVVAQEQPGTVGRISLEVDDNNSNFLNLFFRDDVEEKSASIADLNKKKITIVNKGPVDVVSVSAKSSNSHSMILNVHYLYHFKLFGSIYKVKQFKMHYLAPSNTYETIDVDTNKVIKHAYAYTNYVNGEVKGVSHIETW
jgi:hypothetical protein